MRHNGKELETVALAYAGRPSTFSGDLAVRQAGEYEITVYAYDPASGNTGIDKTTFLVR